MTAEKSPENYILAKGNNFCKSMSSVTKLKLDLYCHNKFINQISSEYLKRLQRKVRKTEVWRTDGQTDWRTDSEQTKSPPGKPVGD